MKATALVLGMTLIAGPAFASTHSDFTKSFPLQRLKTFEFKGQQRISRDPLANNEIWANDVRDAIRKDLMGHGFVEATGGRPDFYVAFYVGLKDRYDVDALGYGLPVLHRRGWWGWPAGYDVWAVPYKESTLIVDVIDARTNQLVWRGYDTDTLNAGKRKRHWTARSTTSCRASAMTRTSTLTRDAYARLVRALRPETLMRSPVVMVAFNGEYGTSIRGRVPANHSRPSRTEIALTSGATAFALFVIGALLETWLISVLQPSEGELTWIGDLVLAISLGVVLYLWLNLRFTRAALAELECNQIVVDTQLAVAAKIQRDLLPPAPRLRHGLTWAVRLVPAGRIGGDYYDFVDLDGQSRIAIVGDIAGKGIPAAMMLVYVRAVFRQAVRETQEPSAIVARLASAVYAETLGESYLTCIVVRIDEERRSITSTTAGHPSALIAGSPLRRLISGGPPAGLFPYAGYEQETTQLVAGNRVILVTDGITERFSAGVESAVAGVDSRLPADDLCAAILNLSEGPRSLPPFADWDDDRTVLVMAVE